MNYLAYNDPMWTDTPPYCNTIRIITTEDAVLAVRRICFETHGVEYPGTDEDALNDFIVVNHAWYLECAIAGFAIGQLDALIASHPAA